jgi:predicted Zn-dependent protease
MRDMAILHSLPAPIAQGTLFAQRENMKKFLMKNEENTLEGVRQYFNIDQKEWSTLMSQVKKDHEFNLSEMRKDQNFNTYHDPAANIFMPELNNACKKYSINPKSLNIGTTSLPNAIAEAYSFSPTQGILWNTYNPGTINFNRKALFNKPLPAEYLNHVALHELTHIMQGHNHRRFTILNHQKICTPSRVLTDKNAYKKFKNYEDSVTSKNLIAAQEKTADTFLSCSDPEVAKINAHHAQNSTIDNGDGTVDIFGYPDNFNDMLVLNTNWETSQNIEKSRKMLQSLKKKIHQTINIF